MLTLPQQVVTQAKSAIATAPCPAAGRYGWHRPQCGGAEGVLAQWTWSCTPPPPGPDTHANTTGYGVIAQAFGQQLP
jgi:hypothetical protein